MQRGGGSTSTTPRSGRGTDPDEYDRIMGLSSVQSPEMERFGDGNVTDTEETDQGVATQWRQPHIASGLGNCPGADLDSRGCGRGSANLAECDRMGDISGLAARWLKEAHVRLRSNLYSQETWRQRCHCEGTLT